MAEIQVFHRESLAALTTIEATAPREWVMDGVSKCTWKMSLNDPKCREDYLQYGNIVYIPHSSLPPWVGVIDSDDNDGRVWSSGRTVTVMASSAGVLFDYADMPNEKIVGTAGRLYEQIIERANSQLLVAPLLKGSIFTGGASREQSLGGSALESIRAIAARSGNNWDVTAEVKDGSIALKANWYAARGQRHDRLLTEQHLGFSDELLRETGKIRNAMTGYGDASTQTTRRGVYVEVEESIGDYGRRRTSQVFSGNKQIDTLTTNTQVAVAKLAYPRKKVRFDIVNEEEIFKLIDLGNVFPFHLDNAGFLAGGGFGTNGEIKTIAFGFNDETENAKVNLSAEVL